MRLHEFELPSSISCILLEFALRFVFSVFAVAQTLHKRVVFSIFSRIHITSGTKKVTLKLESSCKDGKQVRNVFFRVPSVCLTALRKENIL